MTKVTRVAVFWTGASLRQLLPPWEWALVLGIRYFSKTERCGLAEVCHMGLVFQLESGENEVHEALFRDGWSIKPYDKLNTFRARCKHNTLIVGWLDGIAPQAVEAMYVNSIAMAGTRYDSRQIGALAVARSALGRWLRLSIADDQLRTVCSEGACRLLARFAPQWDLRRHPREAFDNVTPQDALNRYRVLLDDKISKSHRE